MDRREIAQREIIKRGGVCDLCGKKGPLEMHEIIERSKTEGDPTLRLYSYAPEVCLFVCRECHDTVAPVRTADALHICVMRWGKEIVGDRLRMMFAMRPTLAYEVELPQELKEYVLSGRRD